MQQRIGFLNLLQFVLGYGCRVAAAWLPRGCQCCECILNIRPKISLDQPPGFTCGIWQAKCGGAEHHQRPRRVSLFRANRGNPALVGWAKANGEPAHRAAACRRANRA